MCSTKCDANALAPHNVFASDKYSFTGKINTYSSIAAIQQAIYTGGPIATAFTVYADFENYVSGIYHHVTGAAVGGHAVREPNKLITLITLITLIRCASWAGVARMAFSIGKWPTRGTLTGASKATSASCAVITKVALRAKVSRLRTPSPGPPPLSFKRKEEVGTDCMETVEEEENDQLPFSQLLQRF
jgi:hypothetical protein